MGWIDVFWGVSVAALVWWINRRRDCAITNLHERIADLETARPVKIEDPSAMLRGFRQDR